MSWFLKIKTISKYIYEVSIIIYFYFEWFFCFEQKKKNIIIQTLMERQLILNENLEDSKETIESELF